MNNPLRILQAVDAKLDQPVEFFLFGRAALVLGFADPPAGAAATSKYEETDRRERANRFVVDAFNGRVDAILSRTKHDNPMPPTATCITIAR